MFDLMDVQAGLIEIRYLICYNICIDLHRKRQSMETNKLGFNVAEAKTIINFTDGRMAPKNDTKTYYIIKNIFILFVIILIVGSLLFKEFLFKDESLAVWICFFIVFGYLLKTGGHQRVESTAQLLFYDDYLIFFVPKHHIKL